MLNDNDKAHLFRALNINQCLLFVGAGFSTDAENKLGAPIPKANELANLLWQWLELSGKYDGSPLWEVYESALTSGKPLRSLRDFLEAHLLAQHIADWYRAVHRIFWLRIYGTNVDNVVEVAHRDSGCEFALDVIAAPKQGYRERDQFLRRVQYVKLNGTLPGSPEEITFATRQYARRSTDYDEWYDHFVRDYALHPTIFVGTELREPLFWQAIESRQKRGDNPEERPRSFLVTPELSPAKAAILEALNIVHVPAAGRVFFGWLSSEFQFPKRAAVLQLVAPELMELFTEAELQTEYAETLLEFLSVFPRVPALEPVTNQPKTFFLGAPPTWNDISADLDSPREYTIDVLKSIRSALEQANLTVIGLLGAGGSGKTTVLRRLALTLRQEGKQVFYSEGGERPSVNQVIDGLKELPDRAVLFIDNANLLGRSFLDVVRASSSIRRPPIIVFAARFNLFERRITEVAQDAATKIFEVPDLTDVDIGNLILTLERNRQLGKLEGLSNRRRFEAFKVRARKQILVAMREATQGRGFDDIIRSEFGEIANLEARTLFLSAALATAELRDLSTGTWLACSAVSPAETLTLLRHNLKGVLVEYNNENRIAARHPIIAGYIVDSVAERLEVMEAYRRVLAALSHDIYGGIGRRGRSWRLFVRLINHAVIYERFTQNIEMARTIYESIAEWFRGDGHFWLQYTNLEIQYGDLNFARTHLAHAESLMPDHDQMLTTKAHLLFRESLSASTRQEALELRIEGEEILLDQIQRLGSEDEYPYHVYLTQMFAWIQHWEQENANRKQALQTLDAVAQEAMSYHSTSPRIRGLVEW